MTEQTYKSSLNLISNSVFNSIDLEWVEAYEPGMGQMLVDIERSVMVWAELSKIEWYQDIITYSMYDDIKSELALVPGNLITYRDDPDRPSLIYDFINAARSVQSFNQNFGLSTAIIDSAHNPFKFGNLKLFIDLNGHSYFQDIDHLRTFNNDILASIEPEKTTLRDITRNALGPVREQLYKLITEDGDFNNKLVRLGFNADQIKTFIPVDNPYVGSVSQEVLNQVNQKIVSERGITNTALDTLAQELFGAFDTYTGSVDDRLAVERSLTEESISGISTLINTYQTGITSLQNYTTDLNTSLNAVVLRTGNAESAIILETNTRVNDSSATNQRIDNVISNLGDTSAAILTEANTRVTNEAAIATQISTLTTAISNGINPTDVVVIQAEETARIAADSAEATTRDSITTKLFGTTDIDGLTVTTVSRGFLYDQQQARLTAETAFVTNITGQISQLSTDLTNAKALIQTESTTRSSADSSLSLNYTTLSNSFNSQAASLTSLQTIVTGDDGITSQWGIKSDVNGYITGLGLITSTKTGTPTSSFIVVADSFQIASPTVAHTPFTSSSSGVGYTGDVSGTVSGTSASTLVSNASVAFTNASAALTSITNISSDSLLTPDEKPSIIAQRDVIITEQAGIDNQATVYSITTEKTAYDAAVTALTAYLATLSTPVLWNNLTGNTTIVGNTFRSKFNDVYVARQALLNKTTEVAGTMSTWGGVSGPGKPADNADKTQTAVDGTIDTTTGGLIVRDAGNIRYAHLTAGDIIFYDYYAGSYKPYKSLKKTINSDIVTGNNYCVDGQVVNLGYFREQPNVILSPKTMQCYHASYVGNSQRLMLDALNMRKVGDDWLFTASCKLQLATGGSVGLSPTSMSQIVYQYVGEGDGELFTTSTGQLYMGQINTNIPLVRKVTVTISANYHARCAHVGQGGYMDYSLQVYNATQGWVGGTNNHLDGLYATTGSWPYITVYTDFPQVRILELSSAYDITGYRVALQAGTYTGWAQDMIDLSFSISCSNCVYTLTSAIISADGQANFIAIG
jgi:hypothetical protein